MNSIDIFDEAINKLIKDFERKHDLEFDGFVGSGSFSSILTFGDYFFGLDDVYYDLLTEQPENKIIEWYDYVLMREYNINYWSFCAGARYEEEEETEVYRKEKGFKKAKAIESLKETYKTLINYIEG